MKNLTFLLLAITLGTSCTKDKAKEPLPPIDTVLPIACDTSAVSFSQEILPLLKLNCTISGCHSNTNTTIPKWENYSTLKTYIDNGSVSYWVFDNALMPPAYAPDSTVLSTCEINLLTAWINQGAQNN